MAAEAPFPEALAIAGITPPPGSLGGLVPILFVFGAIAVFALIYSIVDRVSEITKARANRKAKLYDELTLRHDELVKRERRLAEDNLALNVLARQKSQGFPWLAKAYADFCHLQDLRVADDLEHKPHPARKAAERVREIAAKRRRAEKVWRVLKFQLEYYETLFPWLIDFKGENLEDLIRQVVEKGTGSQVALEEESQDPARHWLTETEYASLPTSEKYQLALERYWTKKKSKWEIGRDYERYVGYLYETKGWKVHYQGIVEGLADLGRDLVATQKTRVDVVQCKCWSKHKVIHEKHIFQLFGTVVAYRIDHANKDASGVFYTSTVLSDRARQFADELGIRYVEQYPFQRYPCVKCNVSRRDGEKIYHLPFDQQYDRTIVEEERLECYVETVKEAEGLGFRRAFRWQGGR